MPATNLHSLRFLAGLADESASVEQRVRSYLAVNCAQCHQPIGSMNSSFDGRIATPLSGARLLDHPLNNTQGDTNNRVVRSGSLTQSMLLTRVATNGAGRMPPLGSVVVDTQAVSLISRWITNDLPNSPTFAAWQISYFGSTNAPDALANADPDAEGARNTLEWLTGTNPTNALEAWGIGLERSGGAVTLTYPRRANRGFELQWSTNLSNSLSWQFFNVPENRPFIAATNGQTRVPDSVTPGSSKFYRARVFEP
jgi:mono/diheme cytochrome c family protein